MNALTYLTGEISSLLAELLITIVFLREVKPKNGNRFLYIPFFIFFAVQHITSFVFYFTGNFETRLNTFTVATAICRSLSVYFCFHGKKLTNLLRYCLYSFSPFLSAIMLITLLTMFGRSESVLYVSSMDGLFFWIILTILHLALIFAILHTMKRLVSYLAPSTKMVRIATAIILALLILSFIHMPLVPMYRNQFLSTRSPMFSYLLSIIALSIVVATATISKSISDQEKAAQAAQYNEFLQHQMKLQYESFMEMERSREDLHKLKHDIANHMLSLQNMIENGSSEPVKYVSALKDRFSEAGKVIICPNFVLNALFLKTQETCDKNGIETHFQVNLPAQLKISDVDLMSVFSNLLSNAVQACERVPQGKRFIRFAVVLRADAIVAFMENSCSKSSASFLGDTSHSDKLEHGWGVRIIKDVTSKYDGKFTIKIDKSKAISKVLMMNKSE